jgi:pimeloyl-ACP methyl ester carboxylesterase
MTRHKRPWLLPLVLFLCAAVAAVGAGAWLGSRGQPPAAAQPGATAVQPGATAAPSAPAPGKAQADLAAMQTALNSGSVSQQAAILVPPMKFASGSGPIVPHGQAITLRPRSLHVTGSHATVQALLSGNTAVTLDLYSAGGHWRLYGAQEGSAQTSAAVTGQPASAQLMADVTSAGQSAEQAGTYQAVIEVHGFGESASNWDSSGMTGVIKAIPGVRVLKFDYSQVNKQWVNNRDIGPALADYIHQVAKASGRPVIVVGFSMGGLAIRYAATTGARAGDIAMDITIGTPNTGSFLGNAYDVACGTLGAGAEMIQPGVCTQWQAASAMGVFNPMIMTLPKLPPSVPLHAIAGDWTYTFKLLGAQVAWPFFGDGVVTTGSALDKRPGWMHDTFDTVANPFVVGDMSAFHLKLTANKNVQALVERYISDYIHAHPVQVQAAPSYVLGSDAYWLADGGTWTVHGLQLQISRGPSGLIGTQTWNAGGNIEIGHAQLAFTSNADGSLTGTYTANGTHTYTQTPPAGFIPEPDADLPQQGQTIKLVPVSPHHANTVYNGNSPSLFVGGNTNLCQDGLPNASQYCGA